MRFILLLISSLLFFQLYTKAQTPHQFYYVSPNGNDNNPGTIENPLATFEGAQQLVRGFKKDSPQLPVTVYFRGGKYYRTQSAIFTSEDSGSKNGLVTYMAYPGEQPIVLGGKKLNLNWEKYSPTIYKASLTEDIEFESLYINDEQQILARYPNFNPEVRIFNGTAEDAIAQERVDQWKDPKGGYFHVLHRALWGGFHYKITGKDPNGNLEMIGGWQNNRPENGLHDKLRYVENIFEELDSPGEWYLDKKSRTLYFMPKKGFDLKNANIEVAYLENFIWLKGDEENPVQYLNFDGFTFNRSVRTFMKTKEPLLRSDWTIYRGGAIFVEGAENCTIQNCDFSQIGSNAVFVSDYNRHITIRGCHVHDIGASAICFVGHPSAVRNPKFIPYGPPVSREELDTIPGPKNNRYPANCIAHDNLLHDLGKVEKQGSGIEISMAMDITISHNSIYNTPRAGINISEGAWGGHIIEFNDVFNTVLETSDHGSFNSWGRDRFWMVDNNRTENRVDEFPGAFLWDAINTTILRNNRMRCDHGWDIDLDDGSSNYHIYNNLCLKNGIKLREGYLRRVENNITINNAIHPHVWLKNNHDIIRGNIFWSQHFPIRVYHWGPQVDYNWFVSEDGLRLAKKNGIEQNSKAGDPQFVDPQNGDFSLREGSPVYELGWKPFPMDQFGVISKRLKNIALEPEVPILSNLTLNKENTFVFFGGEIKNIETAGELSATGMYDKVGALIITVPTEGDFKELKLKVGDVILKINGSSVRDVEGILEELETKQEKGSFKSITVWRNQSELTLD